MGNPGLRLLHVNHAPGWRGGEQQTLYLLEGLRQRGYAPVLAAPIQGVLADRARAMDIPVVHLTARGDMDWSVWRTLRPLAGCFDIVHAHTARAHGWVRSAFFALRNRPRIVVTRRVDFPLKGGWGATWKYSGIDRFIAISECVAGVMELGGVSAEKIRLVYSGIQPERFEVPEDRLGLMRELHIEDPRIRLVGYVGALVDHKGPDVLLEACVSLPDYVHLLFAGDGPLRGRLELRAQELGVGSRVHFLGRREDVPRILRSLHVFALPSRTEGLGTSILDSMAAGTPVIAGRTGGIPEIVEDGRSGLLVTPDSSQELHEAIGRILEDSALASRLGEGGLARVRKFTQDAMVEGTLAVYGELGVGSC